MRKKYLFELKKFLKRKNSNIYDLTFRSTKSALFFLSRNNLLNGLKINLTNLIFITAELVTSLASNVFVFCPLIRNNKNCNLCSLKNGYKLSILDKLIVGYFDPIVIKDFVQLETRIKFSFPCKRNINVSYRLLDQDINIYKVIDKNGIDIYLLTDKDYTLDRIKKTILGYNFYGPIEVFNYKNKIILGCQLAKLKSKNINQFNSEFNYLLSLVNCNLNYVLKYFSNNRISKKQWKKDGNTEILLNYLVKSGFLSYNNYRYYRTRKLTKVLKLINMELINVY